MFNEIQIAQLGYVNYVAKCNKQNEVEGVTVQVPNIIDRVVLAVRSALTRKPAPQRKSVAFGGAPAK